MQLTRALFGGLCVFATSVGRKMTPSRFMLPLESQADLVPATRHLQQIQRYPPTFTARRLETINSTSSSSKDSLYSSTSTSTTSCREFDDGVSITSRVVVNGTRFGACYNSRTFLSNNYSAHFTSREENGLAVRGNEALFVWEFPGPNETAFLWTLARLDGLEIDSIICYNLVDPSLAWTPTSNLLDGEWLCDVDGDGTYGNVDDIQIDCGCSAGVDAEAYYACQDYEDFSLNSSGGLIIDGVSLDGCYEVNPRISFLGYPLYFSGPVEDGVAAMFVYSHTNATTGESAMFWSVGIDNESRVDPACYLDVEVVNNTAETVTPLSDGNWFCDLDADGKYELYNGTVEVQCACIDDSYTTCFESAEGVSLDSSIVFAGDPIGGCYLPTGLINNNAEIFGLGDPSTVGSILIHFYHIQDASSNFDDDVWTMSRVREYDEDTQTLTLDDMCLAPVLDIELPTDPLLKGEWLCRDAAGEYYSNDASDFEEVTCGCRGEVSSSSTPVGVASTTPAPILDFTSPTSSLLYPTSRPEATTAREYPVPFPTNLPADGNTVATRNAPEEQAEQYIPVGVIIGSSIGGVALIAGVLTIILRGRSRSMRSCHDSCSSPAGSTSSGKHPGQSCTKNATSTSQIQSLPPVNPERPSVPNGHENSNNCEPPPPRYEHAVML